MTLSAMLVTLIASYVIPIITALITKASASVGLKQLLTAAMAAATGLLAISTQSDGTAVMSKQSAILALASFATAQATYWGLFRPHQLNATLAPGAGLGNTKGQPTTPVNSGYTTLVTVLVVLGIILVAILILGHVNFN